MMTSILVSLVIVILLSALFSGMEIAFIASNKFLMEIDMSNKTLTSRILDKFYRNSNNFISSLLVGNNIVIVIYGILMANLLNSTILATLNDTPSLQLLLQTIISTIIIIIIGEFFPKALFRIDPNSTMKRFAFPVFILYVLLYPISRFTTWISCLLLRLLNVKINKETRDTTFSKTELTHLIQSSIENAKEEEENIDNEENFMALMTAINNIAEKYQMPVIYSTHPRSMKFIEKRNFKFHPLVQNLKPFGFMDYNKLQKTSYCVLSDSGTLSEESAMLGFSGVLLRTSTERPEVLDKGSVVIGGIKTQDVERAIELSVSMRENNEPYVMAEDYADMNVSVKVVKLVQSYTHIVNKTVWLKS